MNQFDCNFRPIGQVNPGMGCNFNRQRIYEIVSKNIFRECTVRTTSRKLGITQLNYDSIKL